MSSSDEGRIRTVAEGWHVVRAGVAGGGAFDPAEAGRHLVGAALDGYLDVMARRAPGLATVRLAGHEVFDVAVDGDAAVALECEVRRDAGGDERTQVRRTDLVRTADGWRIAGAAVLREWR